MGGKLAREVKSKVVSQEISFRNRILTVEFFFATVAYTLTLLSLVRVSRCYYFEALFFNWI